MEHMNPPPLDLFIFVTTVPRRNSHVLTEIVNAADHGHQRLVSFLKTLNPFYWHYLLSFVEPHRTMKEK